MRQCVQACLTLLWNEQAWLVQSLSPASLVARTLQKLLGRNLKDYTFVDFCAGAGGPTPYIEREVNEAISQDRNRRLNGDAQTNGLGDDAETTDEGVDFILTDIHPHIPAWSKAAKKSDHLRYVKVSVDASDAPNDLFALADVPRYGNTIVPGHRKKTFRLFNLAFHHFPDPLALSILRNTLETSDGFAIFELQGRDLGNLLTVCTLAPLLWMGSWYWFWGQWEHLFWTYVIPVVPFVIVFDGLVSCLRTRRKGEIMDLIRRADGGKGLVHGWRFEAGGEVHTWPTGTMQYFVGIKEK